MGYIAEKCCCWDTNNGGLYLGDELKGRRRAPAMLPYSNIKKNCPRRYNDRAGSHPKLQERVLLFLVPPDPGGP